LGWLNFFFTITSNYWVFFRPITKNYHYRLKKIATVVSTLELTNAKYSKNFQVLDFLTMIPRAFRTRPFRRTRTRDSDWSPKFGLGLGLGLKKSWLSYTLTQNYQSMKYLWRFNYSRYLCMWFIKGIIGFKKRKIWNFRIFWWNVDFFTV
jgi:hypothetical protein